MTNKLFYFYENDDELSLNDLFSLIGKSKLNSFSLIFSSLIKYPHLPLA